MNKYIAILLSILATTANADPWLCIADQSTGFYFENGKWDRTNFDVSESKYIIREFTKDDGFVGFVLGEKYTHGVFPLGDKNSMYQCIIHPTKGHFDCSSGAGDFLFLAETGRYLKSNMAGYVWGDEFDTFNSPRLERGRCSRI